MSDLLNQASLVMVPSGYKEDTVYSVIPTDGSGDLSFTRASNGTRVNSAGLVEVCPWNLIEDSENFGVNAVVYITIGSNVTTAPNGTTTADSMIEDGTNNLHAVYDFGALTYVAGVYTLSCYVKKGIRDWVRVQFYDGTNTQSVWANVNTGVLGTVVSPATASIENVGNGWYRISISTAMLSATGGWAIYSATSDGGTTYTGTNGATALYLWGLQTNIGSTAKPYFPTTDRLNVPRLTYQNGGGGCPSLLLEKQSTNLVTYSEQLDNAAWIKLNGSVTANIAVSPDGTSNADAFIPNTTSGIHALRSNLFNQSATASHSWFVKANGYTKIAVRESELVGNYATFNLTTGTLISTNQTGSIQNLGNGWYRCTLVDTTTGVNAQTSILVLPDSYTSGDPIVVNWSGDGTKGVFAWGAQVEISSYPTSYIPTTSASATRVADLAYKTSATALIGQTEGVLFCDFNLPSVETSGDYPFVVNMYDSTLNRFGFARYPNGGVHVYMVAGGSSQFTYNTTQLTGRFKLALGYKANDCVIYLNGTLLQTITSATIPATSQIIFNDLNVGGGYATQSQINQAILFKTRLTNAELASLTTI